MNKIYVIGDLHQDFKPVRCFFKTVRPDPSDTLIVLGDFGANFFLNDDHRDRNFKQKLRKYKVQYFVIRGNHEKRPSVLASENPDKWEKEYLFDNQVWVEKEYPYIKYAMDYPCIYDIEGLKTLVYPGAYSIDKWYRLSQGWQWFDDELPTVEEYAAGKFMARLEKECDLVLSHTCPSIFEPTDLFLSGVNQSLVDKSMETYLSEIENMLDYKLWLFGHFHAQRVYPESDKGQVVMLFNQAVLNLNKYFETKDIYNSLIYIQEV